MKIEMKSIQEKAKKKGTEISFQNLTSLTDWWSLVRDGEPWIVSSLEKPYAIFDDTGYLTLVSNLVHKGHVYNRGEKVERLVDRTYYYKVANRQLLLDALNELFLASLEAAQIFLMTKGHLNFDPKKMVSELRKHNLKNLDGFVDIVDLIEKVNKGVLSEFTGENADHYGEKIKNFVNEIEERISGE